MNATSSSLLALLLTIGAVSASAQSFELYAPRGADAIDNGPRIVQEAQQLKGIATRPTGNEADAAKSLRGTYYLKASVLIQGAGLDRGTKRIMFAKGRTKQEALTNLRDQVNAIGANARVVRIEFIQ